MNNYRLILLLKFTAQAKVITNVDKSPFNFNWLSIVAILLLVSFLGHKHIVPKH